jgi:hypothetical protein
MDKYRGPSLVIKTVVPVANDDLYNVSSLRAGRQTDILKKFIENEVDRLLDKIWAKGPEPDLGGDRHEQ